jgi:hypothetical protein
MLVKTNEVNICKSATQPTWAHDASDQLTKKLPLLTFHICLFALHHVSVLVIVMNVFKLLIQHGG